MAADPRPGRVPREVLEWFDRKQIVPSFSYQDVWNEEHRAAFAVAKAVEVDVLESIREGMREAIERGLPFDQFRRNLTPTLQEKGWWGTQTQTDPVTGERGPVQLGSKHRLDRIYETNVRTARSAGQWQRIQRTKRAMPFLIYRTGPSAKHRDDHLKNEGKVYPVDHSFWDYWMPINGYGCKCWVEQVTRRRAEDLGGPHEPDPIDMELVETTNTRTGDVVRHPIGVQPTFAYNPGKDRFEGLRQAGLIE